MEKICKNCIYNYKPLSPYDYYVKALHYPRFVCEWGKENREQLFYLCTNENVSKKDHSNDTIIMKSSREENINGNCQYFRSGTAEDIIPSTISLTPFQEEIEIDDTLKLEVTVTPYHRDETTEEIPVLDSEGNPVINEETGLPETENIIIEPEFTNDQDIEYKYQWYKNDRKLFKEKEPVLEINAEEGSEDRYFCEVTQRLADNGDGGNKVYVSQTSVIIVKAGKINAYSSITKVEDYLYETEYEKLDYKKAEEFFKTYAGEKSGCSAVRKGNIYGRNYDWYYDDRCSFIVRTSAAEGRNSVLGVSGGVPSLTKTLVEAGKYSEMFRYMPFLLLDGINEHGVVCSINVVPKGDMGVTTGTVPKVEERERINQVMLVRYILDNFQSAEEAVSYISNYVSVFAPGSIETHFMVADENNTYSIEFINNETVIRELEKPYMTNFYLENVGYTDGHVDFSTVTDYGSGLERFDLITDEYSSVSDVNSMAALMDSLKYTNAYDKTREDFWYTEFVGDYTKEGYGKVKVTSTPEEFEPVVDIAVSRFENRSRFVLDTWQTVHSSIYEIEDRKLTIKCQEGSIPYEFTLS